MTQAALLNAKKLDFDDQLDFGPIEEVVSVVRYDDTETDHIVDRALGCRILITKELPVPAPVLDRLAPGTLVCEAGTGVNNIDLEHLESIREREIVVCNVPDYSSRSVSHLTLRFVLDLAAGNHVRVRTVDEMDVTSFYAQPLNSVDGIDRKILGVVGAGCIGRRVIQRARGFGMNVLVNSRTERTWPHDERVAWAGLNELLERSDFVSLHVPFIPGTPYLIGPQEILRMRQDAYLINTARGELVDQDALVEAIENGRIAGAALDVQTPEPLPAGHALLSMENVTLTPHIGWKAIDSRRRLIEQVARNIEAFVDPQRATINTVRHDSSKTA